jgi:hypothetical protein
MNVFAGKKVYETNWTVKETRNFTAEEIAMVDKATVIESPEGYGNSVCFVMKAGGKTFIPMSRDSKAGVGEEINLSTAKIITLCKSGEADIERIEA